MSISASAVESKVLVSRTALSFSPLALYPAETLDRCEIYENLPKDTLRLYDRLWTRLGV